MEAWEIIDELARNIAIGCREIWGMKAETEAPENRPNCGWPVTTKKDGVETTERCKSEKDLFNVKGRGKYTSRARETDICGKHLTDATKKWNWESAEKYPRPVK